MKKIFFFLMVLMITGCQNKKVEGVFEGKDVFKEAGIIRNSETNTISISVNTDGSWKIYSGTPESNIDMSRPLMEGSGKGIHPVIKIDNSVRNYFQLVTDEGKAVIAEKHLPMEGGYNFRDLGGIRNKDGKYTKWGKIFRSDDLHNLTDSDLKYLASIPLISVVDFRSDEERKWGKDKIPSTVVNNYILSIDPGNLSDMDMLSNISAQQIDSFMMQMNVLFVTKPVIIDKYKELFSLLQNSKEVPLLFHCSAGKDRTGMGTALILFALNVDEESIYEDYLLSNKYLRDKYSKYIDQNPALESLFKVKKEFLQAGIEQIKKDHGTVENYLTKVLNIDLDKFKKMYLY